MDLRPFYRRPAFRTALGVAFLVALYGLSLEISGLRPALPIAAYHLLLALASLLVMTALTAQFVLPVQRWDQRLLAVGRLLGFLVGIRGPVLFVESGDAVKSERELERKGPGVLLVDYASAAVLRTETEFSPPVGPGLTFTAGGEILAKSLDLRRQNRVARGGPPAGADAEGEATSQTLALTQDGIPVTADLSITFMLHPGHESSPREGRFAHLPPFEYDPQSVQRAVFGHAYDGRQDVPWTDLPMRLAIDLWREQIKNHRLEELFSSTPRDPSPLRIMREAILERLTSPWASFPAEGGSTRVEPSREHELLSSRGIRVLDFGLSAIHIPEEIQDERAQRWCERWGAEVQEALGQLEEMEKEARRRGEQEARQRLLVELTKNLRMLLAEGVKPDHRAALLSILEDAVRISSQRGIVADGATLAMHLREIVQEIHGMGPEGADRPPAAVP